MPLVDASLTVAVWHERIAADSQALHREAMVLLLKDRNVHAVVVIHPCIHLEGASQQ